MMSLNRQRKFAAILLAFAGLVSGETHAQEPPAGAVPSIDWRVADRFRLFSRADEPARRRIDALMDEIARDPARPLSDFHDAFRDTLGGASGASLRTSNYARPVAGQDPGSGRYRADYLYQPSYQILLHSDDAALNGRNCRWTSPFGTAQGPCEHGTSLPVGPARQVSGHWTVSTIVRLSIDGGGEASYPIVFQDRLIVALGDSYISGEGNPDVPSVIDDRPREIFGRASWGGELPNGSYARADWWDEPCHRSLLSWPVLASVAYAARHPREAVTLIHLGCSGAIVGDLIRRGERDLPGGGNEPASEFQLAQLDGLLTAATAAGDRRTPDALLLSVGGNDSGFVGVIATIVLPPDGYWLPGGAHVVGSVLGAVCPYRNTGPPLASLCKGRDSAELRMEAKLPDSYAQLATVLGRPGWGRVHQFAYPNPIVDDRGSACTLRLSRDPVRLADMNGFEALMGVVPGIARGRHYTWDFELIYDPEHSVEGPLFNGIGCDGNTEPDDSEVCQALWVHAELNRIIRTNETLHNWHVVTRHADTIFGHGLCRQSPGFERALPRVVNGNWVDGWTPRSLRAYDGANQRWFRAPNDSVVVQNDGPKRFYQGTMHPTLSAHLAYADAALAEALGP